MDDSFFPEGPIEAARVTYLHRVTATDRLISKSLGSVFAEIRSARQIASAVEKIRAEIDPTKQKKLKKRTLPAVIFSGEFSTADNDGLLSHSGLAIIDFDSKDNPELEANWPSLQQALREEPRTAGFFRSPRDGLKWLVAVKLGEGESLEARKVRHAAVVGEAVRFAWETWGLKADAASDVSRKCYLSFDPEAVLQTPTAKFCGLGDDTTGSDPQCPLYTETQKLRNTEIQEVPPQSPPFPLQSKDPDLPEALAVSPKPFLITGRGQANKVYFNFVNKLKRVYKRAGVIPSDSHLREHARRWVRAHPPGLLKESEEYFEDWMLQKFEAARGEEGGLVQGMALELAKLLPHEGACAGTNWEEPQRLLASICWHLRGSDGSFFLSAWDAGRLCGRSQTTAHVYLKRFDEFRRIVVLRKGENRPGGRATEFRWIGPAGPVPTEAQKAEAKRAALAAASGLHYLPPEGA